MPASDAAHGQLLPRLTAFRAYAALGVFLLHVNAEIGWRPLRPFDVGGAGVSFFFVLSGFVLTWTIGSNRSVVRFYRRRFARVYPATLVTGLVAAGLVAGHLFALRGGALGAITSVLLLQAWFPGTYPVYSYNGVAWTLSCEAFFYALLPPLVREASGRSSRTIVMTAASAVAFAAGATVILIHVGHADDLAYNNPVIRLPEFTTGVALGLLSLRGWRPSVPLWPGLLLVAAGAGLSHRWPASFPLEDYFMLPGFVLVLASGIGSDLREKQGFLTSRLSVYLGELSFCFYLVHYLVIVAIVHEAGWHGRSFSLLGGFYPVSVTFLASIAAAILLRSTVELPMQSRLRPRRP